MSKKKADAHHGGAWKVAYADFVTAMMALFMVLWISSQDQETLKATAEFFRHPYRPIASPHGEGVLPHRLKQPSPKDKAQEQAQEATANAAFLEKIARQLVQSLHLDTVPETERPLDVAVTPLGMQITLYDRPGRPVFRRGSATFTEWGSFALQNLAWLIDQHRFRVVIEGHTAAGFASGRPDYGPWELTADRANAARRAMEFFAVRADQIKRVTGYGDTLPLPRLPADAEDNQRLTVSLAVNPRGAPELVKPAAVTASAATTAAMAATTP